MKIKEIMTKNPIIVPPSTKLIEVRSIFKKYKFRNIFIGSSNHFLGLIGRNYLFSQINESNLHSTVERIMVRDVITIDENSDVYEAIQVMKNKKISVLGVTRNGKPSGVITKFDLNKKYYSNPSNIIDNRERNKMAICYYCNKKISGMPFNCRKCGEKFCGNHQIPESHNCSGLKKSVTSGSARPKPNIEELYQKLTHSSRDARRNAASQLDKQGWTPKSESDKVIFYFAYERWGKLVKLGLPALPLLLSGLRDQDASIQESSIKALGELGNPDAISQLIQKLDDPNLKIKLVTGKTLGKLGWKPEKIEEKTIFLIANDRWDDLKKLGPAAVDPLIELLSNNLKEYRLQNKDKSLNLSDDEHFALSNNINAIINVLGEIQDVRAWNPLIDLANHEGPEWPNELIFKSIKKIEAGIIQQKQKSNLYCIGCFHKYQKYPQSPSITSNYYQNYCNITDLKISIPIFNSRVFAVCRNCKSNKKYIEQVIRVELILENSEELYNFINGILSLNWFKIKRPVDFDIIFILSATNEDVSELIMKLKNDEDIERKKKYKSIPVFISKDLNISQAKINLLRKTFEIVQVVERNNMPKLGELKHVRLDSESDNGN